MIALAVSADRRRALNLAASDATATIRGVRKWCDECQTLIEPELRRAEMQREGGSGPERSLAPRVERCPNDPGDWSHMLSVPNEPTIGS
ncbi:MAG TPA: hypothetical protein VG368_07090 [Acidimicrobiales bacterium]|nr:hypothetical protein [Acidimicrobiales bacterium]